MRAPKAAAALAAIAVLGAVSSCGTESGKDSGPGRGHATSHPRASGESADSSARSAKPLPRLKTSDGFDTAHGWSAALGDEDVLMPVTRSNAVAVLKAGDRSGTVVVRDAATGRVKWRSAPLTGLSADSATEHPAAFTTRIGGRDLVVVWGQGTVSGGGGLAKGRQVVSVDVFGLNSSGSRVKPMQVLLPVGSDPITAVRPGGSRLLARAGNHTIAIDPQSGERATFSTDDAKPPHACDSCVADPEIAGFVGGKPLFNTSSTEGDGFWVQGGWDSRKLAPAAADPSSGLVAVGPDGNLIARWTTKSGGGRTLWTVLDGTTGKTRATAACPAEDSSPLGDLQPQTSSDGRYVVFGHAAFDLSSGTGRCFIETGSQKPVTFASVDDHGTAYGGSNGDNPAAGGYHDTSGLLTVNVTGGSPDFLPDGSDVPVAVFRRTALFTPSNDAATADAGMIAYAVK